MTRLNGEGRMSKWGKYLWQLNWQRDVSIDGGITYTHKSPTSWQGPSCSGFLVLALLEIQVRWAVNHANWGQVIALKVLPLRRCDKNKSDSFGFKVCCHLRVCICVCVCWSKLAHVFTTQWPKRSWRRIKNGWARKLRHKACPGLA